MDPNINTAVIRPLAFQSFNSLQTGKWILTLYKVMEALVKISFNSLQTGKWILTEGDVDTINRTYGEFQFPSNGKVDPNFNHDMNLWGNDQFQFPSNGKVDPNRTGKRIR